MTEDHWDAIEAVLERHGLALVVERDSGIELVGVVDDRERRAFDALKRRGRARCDEVAIELGESTASTRDALDAMWRRRLIMRQDDDYLPIGSGEIS